MAEIRLRDVPKETMQKLQKVALIIRSAKTNTQLLEKMITKIVEDQESIKQLQARNNQLHAAIEKYYRKENASRQTLQSFIAHSDNMMKVAKNHSTATKKLMKQFGTKR